MARSNLNFSNSLNKTKKNLTKTLLGTFLGVLGLGAGIILTQQPQLLSERAAVTNYVPMPSAGASCGSNLQTKCKNSKTLQICVNYRWKEMDCPSVADLTQDQVTCSKDRCVTLVSGLPSSAICGAGQMEIKSCLKYESSIKDYIYGWRKRSCNENGKWGSWSGCSYTWDIMGNRCFNSCSKTSDGCSLKSDMSRSCDGGSWGDCKPGCTYSSGKKYAKYEWNSDGGCMGYKCVLPKGCKNSTKGYLDSDGDLVDKVNCQNSSQ